MSSGRKRATERDLYQPVKDCLEGILAGKFSEFHLEITASAGFGNRLKAQVPQHRDIIFSFFESARPDITGFIKGEYSVDFVVAEIKNQTLKLDDIYQTRKYAELFDAKYAVLISIEEIPEEIKRLHRVVYSLLSLPSYRTLTIARFPEESNTFIEWFPKNPFEDA